ncbi:Vga family ABC-F type ribosomal protection protein [Staphylococcus epidermidis]|uniref:Vga family ABC-F type ribosomal protection protein n=1 Tax=Staphylococcus epidermidis TaxID=1282 RepID=UPI00111A0F33|nr:Vga family ABC-F type ribosomal protection protein [Staphylococcus epidermidis]MBM6028353.1 Vga family ABC-F type ribosomal protection protein [Staphylococcus epidermidis]MBM6035007.1 Vga family ABC-F type ribosomal protection protein [Staphylococcus epidermidis]MBM6037316.1 Vga family ABC-F type ribosomal protection protein [Staphylococcus epidermidis]MBM6039501.1 Vga family ABC-F type ribosomal protection protein [Staphylococcus epidermidis]MBM6055466.1 Vga family ABC-F type ribosomal pro
MLKIDMKNVKKYYADKLILNIKELKIYSGDKIGIVGKNGVGKTTLLKIIKGLIEIDEGNIIISEKTTIKYISQLEEPHSKIIDGKYASIFQVENKWNDNMSGGEKTRFKLAEGFQDQCSLMLVDEPTSNLDIEGIELITNTFKEYRDTFLVVSHDRIFLDQVCTKIFEIENGYIREFIGNYTNYIEQKEMLLRKQQEEYEKYNSKRKQLEQAIKLKENKAQGMIKPPSKTMGTSESRIWKMQHATKQKKMHRNTKSLETRIDKLNHVEKIKELPSIKMDLPNREQFHGRNVISLKNLSIKFNNQFLWRDASFVIKGGEKVAIIGNNGVGKTTLLKLILEKVESVIISPSVKIGYVSQNLDVLQSHKSILENVMSTSIQDETIARIVLARLHFYRNDVHKEINVLSGGEQIKVAFAKLFVSDCNTLILDEPTNYLDIDAVEALEELLITYEGVVLFASYDKKFIQNLAEQLLIIENNKVKKFEGTYIEYLKIKDKPKLNTNEKELKEKKMILEMQISSLLSKISMEENEEKNKELDEKYKLKLKELKSLNKNI